MRTNRHLKAPQSNYVKYDVFEKQKAKLFKPAISAESDDDEIDESNQIDPPTIKYVVGTDSNEPDNQNPPPPAATMRSSKQYTDYVYSARKPDYGHADVLGGHVGELYTSYGTAYKNHYEPESQDGYGESQEDEKKSSQVQLPKKELIKHIQHSVMKYMKELEAEGKFSPTPTRTPPIEIKTYYRFPTSTPSSEEYSSQIGKDHMKYPKVYISSSEGPSEYFKDPPRATPSPATYHQSQSTDSSNDLFPSTTMTPTSYHGEEESSTPHIDLTFRSKARPKPIDLAALDVGQSWSHDPELHAEHHSHSTRHKKNRPKKLKQLNFNSQTYHDINSMSSQNTKSVHNFGEHPAKENGHETSSHNDYKHVTPVRFKDDLHATGHHSIATPPEGFSEDAINEVQQHYRSPIHVINGIPVANPYKFNMNQLK